MGTKTKTNNLVQQRVAQARRDPIADFVWGKYEEAMEMALGAQQMAVQREAALQQARVIIAALSLLPNEVVVRQLTIPADIMNRAGLVDTIQFASNQDGDLVLDITWVEEDQYEDSSGDSQAESPAAD